MDAYAGEFSLATAVRGHRAGTLVRVAVSSSDSARLLLEFSTEQQVLTDACALLCGHSGTRQLVELGYSGPLIRRPPLAA